MGNDNVINYQPSWHKSRLVRGDDFIKEMIDSSRQKFGYDFVDGVTKRYRSKIFWGGWGFNFWDQGDEGGIEFLEDVSRCKKILPQRVMRSIGIPLPIEHLEVLEESLDWEDVQWSQTGVWIAGKEYTLARVHFLSL